MSLAKKSTQPRSALEAQPRKDFDALLCLAARGDMQAIGAISLVFYEDFVSIVNDIVHDEDDARDIVGELLTNLAEGRGKPFAPGVGGGIAWMEGLLRSMAGERAYKRDTLDIHDPRNGEDVYDLPDDYRVSLESLQEDEDAGDDP
jgi:hypothetical protein